MSMVPRTQHSTRRHQGMNAIKTITQSPQFICACSSRAPTFPVYRSFEHFTDCPLSLAEAWQKLAMSSFKESDDWERRYLDKLPIAASEKEGKG